MPGTPPKNVASGNTPLVNVPPLTQNPPSKTPKCRVLEQPDGGLQVSFLVEPDVAKRLRTRANGMAIEVFLWENILKRATIDYVY